jgi:hypothetical protein
MLLLISKIRAIYTAFTDLADMGRKYTKNVQATTLRMFFGLPKMLNWQGGLYIA